MADIPAIETLPPPPIVKTPEITAPVSTGGFVPQEQPGAVLGIIETSESAGDPPRVTIEKIAEADIPKVQKSPETPAAPKQPETPKEKPVQKEQENQQQQEVQQIPAEEAKNQESQEQHQQEDEADKLAKEAMQKERELIKQQLRELGKLLVTHHDTRALTVALALSAGDTPIGDEFRKETLRSILASEKISEINDNQWQTMQQSLGEAPDIEHTELGKFLQHHKVRTETFRDAPEEFNAIMQNVDKKGRTTPIAQDLQRELGWNTDHPMPKTAEVLASQIDNEQTTAEDMKKVYTKGHLAEGFNRLRETTKKIKMKAPTFIYVGLIAMSYLGQMMQEAEGQQRH